MINPPTSGQIEKWSQTWQYARPMIELQTEIEKSDQKIDSQHHQFQAAPDMTSLQIDILPQQAQAFLQPIIYQLALLAQSFIQSIMAILQIGTQPPQVEADKRIRVRRYNAIKILINHNVASLRAEMGKEMISLGLEPPWSKENRASGKYQTEDKALIPIAIRFFRSLKEIQEHNGCELPLEAQDGARTTNTILQDAYGLSFYAPNPRPSSNIDLEPLRRRTIHRATTADSFPAILHSASVAMAAYILEDQASKVTQSRKLFWAQEATECSAFSWFKAALALLDDEETIDAESWVGFTQNALENGNSDIIKTCMSILGNNQTITNAALIDASKHGYEAVVKKLVDVGADVNVRDDRGRTALMWACAEGHETVVKKLVDVAADVNVRDDRGRTALMWACAEGHETVVKQLVDVRADVNVRDDRGRTALMWACAEGHETVVKKLVDVAADVNVSDDHGRTALMDACWRGNTTMVSILLEACADIQVKDENGRTALMWACARGKKEPVVKQYENGQTALIWACAEGHETVVEQLIRSGAYVNATDEKYQTAYNYAVDSGHSSLANRLIALQERTEYIDIDISNQLSERWF